MVALVCRRVGVILVLVLALASPSAAQAVLSGIVLDPMREPVAGATIYVTNTATKAQLDFVTTPEGRFEFSGLPAGDYRLTSDTQGILPVTVMLSAGAREFQEIVIAFGPFTVTWQVVPPSVPAIRGGGTPPPPPGFRCAERGRPLCGPESLVQEFERDEADRLRQPVLGPRMVRMPDQSYPPGLVESRIEGAVTLEARVGVDGSLIGLRVAAADDPRLGEAALASAASATWEPARIRGTAVEVPLTIRVQYILRPQSVPQPGTIAQSLAPRAAASPQSNVRLPIAG